MFIELLELEGSSDQRSEMYGPRAELRLISFV